jgi:thiol-disulfide isomerase/thioredoxin
MRRGQEVLSNAIQLGPLLLPFMLLLVFASAGSSLALGKWLSKSSAEVDRALWHALLVGVVLARLAFVYEYRSLYLASPLTIVDIRDGGWNPTFGVLGAWMFELYRERRTPAIRRPLRWALTLGTAMFFVGTAVLALQGGSGQKLPELAFASLDGKTVQLKEFEGKPTVVNLWATWCPPCVREMPVLHEAQEQHREINFVFLNQGEEPGLVSRWLSSQRLPLRNVLLDPKRHASAAFQQQGYPTTLFFNAKGELVSSRIGELSAATLSQKLSALAR